MFKLYINEVNLKFLLSIVELFGLWRPILGHLFLLFDCLFDIYNNFL